jgi:hypothetical protein
VRNRLSYANVVSTLALVFALGTGGAWAATQIHGNLIKKNTITGSKIKKTTITHREINEKKLKAVPRALLADSAQTANVAQVANTLAGGIPPAALVQGGGTQQVGHTTGGGGSDPNVLRTLTTPVGEFRLQCGAANADARYFNTSAGNASVVKHFYVESAPDNTTYESVAANGDTGYAATPGTGTAYMDLTVGKGDAAAILHVGIRREGGNCIFNWELASTG